MTRPHTLLLFSSALLLIPACGNAAPPASSPTATTTATAKAAHEDGHEDGHDAAEKAHSDQAATKYTCTMHPEIQLDEPGSCPKCGMTLVPVADGHDDHGGMSGMSGMSGMEGMEGMEGMADHMAHMNEVRAGLQAKLGAAYDQPVAGLDTADAAAGAAIYASTCVSCHGTKGKGDGPAAAALPIKPADHSDPEHSAYYSDAGRIEVIQHGIPGSPMVGFGAALSQTDLLNLYAYVVSLRDTSGGEHHHHHDENDEHDDHDDHDDHDE